MGGRGVPEKVRELIAELKRAGFVERAGKGSHRRFIDPVTGTQVTLSGHSGADARKYQVLAVRKALREAGK